MTLGTEECVLSSLGDAKGVEKSVSLLLTSLLKQHSSLTLIYHFKPGWVGAPLEDLTTVAQVLSALEPLNLPRVYSTSSSLTLSLGGGRRHSPF